MSAVRMDLIHWTSFVRPPFFSFDAGNGLLLDARNLGVHKLTMFARLLRSVRNRLSHSQTEDLDNETLLPASSTASLTLETAREKSKTEYWVALRTLLVCSIVYLSAGLWIAHSVRKVEFVTNADEFCIGHVSQYCGSGESKNGLYSD